VPAVDPSDDAIDRFVVCLQKYPAGRRVPEEVDLAAFDTFAEAMTMLERLKRDEPPRPQDRSSDAREIYTVKCLDAGAVGRGENGRIVSEALDKGEGVSPSLDALELPQNLAVAAWDDAPTKGASGAESA
jgi:hypothetical protein